MGIRENTFGTITPIKTDYIRVIDDPAGAGDSKNILISALETLLNNELSFLGADGWSAVTGWSYASATTINVTAGATAIYSVGDKIRFQNNDSGTYLYAYVVGVASTLLTVLGDAVPNATLTDCYYSKASTPVGFPDLFYWTPTISGYSANPSGGIYRYYIRGRVVSLIVREPNAGTSTTGATTYTTPIAAKTLANMIWMDDCIVVDNGSPVNGSWTIPSGSNVITFYKAATASSAFTTSGDKRITGAQITYDI